MARGKRPAPFRTRKLSLSAPMVLQVGTCGRVGRRRTYKHPREASVSRGCCGFTVFCRQKMNCRRSWGTANRVSHTWAVLDCGIDGARVAQPARVSVRACSASDVEPPWARPVQTASGRRLVAGLDGHDPAGLDAPVPLPHPWARWLLSRSARGPCGDEVETRARSAEWRPRSIRDPVFEDLRCPLVLLRLRLADGHMCWFGSGAGSPLAAGVPAVEPFAVRPISRRHVDEAEQARITHNASRR